MLRTWCKTNQLFSKTNLSHVLMDGGKLSIPFDKLENFMAKAGDLPKKLQRN